MRAYRSLVAQTYPNWEWVLYDDLLDDHTFVALTALAKTDPRLHVSSKMIHSASSYEGIREETQRSLVSSSSSSLSGKK